MIKDDQGSILCNETCVIFFQIILLWCYGGGLKGWQIDLKPPFDGFVSLEPFSLSRWWPSANIDSLIVYPKCFQKWHSISRKKFHEIDFTKKVSSELKCERKWKAPTDLDHKKNVEYLLLFITSRRFFFCIDSIVM